MIDTSWGSVSENKDNDITVQGSEAWKIWRGKGLGSSDAAVLLGWSPWKKIEELYEEKLGLWKPTFGPHQRAAMERGTKLEPVIRKWYEEQVGSKFKEDTQEDPNFTYRRASFDGINREFKNEDGTIGKIIEIKAPNKKDHELAHHGVVTEKYLAQINWLMMVANVEWCDYVSYGSDDSYAVLPIKANKNIQRELAERAHLFWQHVQTKTSITHWSKYEEQFEMLDLSSVKTPELETKVEAPIEEPVQVLDQEIETIVALAIQAQHESDVASAKFEALKEKLKKILGKEEKMHKGQAVFGWQKRKGNVDYSIIPELIGLELDQFRKPETRAFYFKKVDPTK